MSASVAPPDLWSKLARLDRTCDVQMLCVFDGDQRRGMRVRARPKRWGKPDTIEAEAPSLAAALSEVIVQAEALGWLDR
jgi:hypothetical protein